MISIVLLLGTTLIASKYLPLAVRAYKLEFHLVCFSSHAYLANATNSMRRIIQQQTVGDHQRARSSLTTGHHSGLIARSRRFWRVFFQYGVLLVTVIFAGIFVHIISLYRITTQLEMLGFTGGSIAFKLLVQESIKMYVIKRNIKDIRTMCVVVGLPTVLIDTQLRIALQRTQVSGLALWGTILMAFAEICMRTTKVMRIKYEIRHRAKTMFLAETVPAIQQFPSQDRLGRKHRDRNPMVQQRRASTTISLRFERWKHKLLAFHAAEIYADMSAEYIAIGCSSAILYFYWDHPKYALATTLAVPSSVSAQMPLLGIQFGIEIVIDYIASAIEIGGGIDFDEIRKYGLFVACAFITITVINIQISAIMYMRVNSDPN
uniref:ABC transmembrane type-1 domain-containing protein n=1 Tax=Globisporangium ultimum (strain ATCC 200006 / CBS 805.95 / DAOM BR144) TaxID=431595 RepID=K3WIZ5_GLOUD